VLWRRSTQLARCASWWLAYLSRRLLLLQLLLGHKRQHTCGWMARLCSHLLLLLYEHCRCCPKTLMHMLQRRVLQVLLPSSLHKRACGRVQLMMMCTAVLLSRGVRLTLRAVDVACSRSMYLLCLSIQCICLQGPCCCCCCSADNRDCVCFKWRAAWWLLAGLLLLRMHGLLLLLPWWLMQRWRILRQLHNEAAFLQDGRKLYHNPVRPLHPHQGCNRSWCC
jgi:hypothetical protein